MGNCCRIKQRKLSNTVKKYIFENYFGITENTKEFQYIDYIYKDNKITFKKLYFDNRITLGKNLGELFSKYNSNKPKYSENLIALFNEYSGVFKKFENKDINNLIEKSNISQDNEEGGKKRRENITNANSFEFSCGESNDIILDERYLYLLLNISKKYSLIVSNKDYYNLDIGSELHTKALYEKNILSGLFSSSNIFNEIDIFIDAHKSYTHFDIYTLNYTNIFTAEKSYSIRMNTKLNILILKPYHKQYFKYYELKSINNFIAQYFNYIRYFRK